MSLSEVDNIELAKCVIRTLKKVKEPEIFNVMRENKCDFKDAYRIMQEMVGDDT